MIRMNYHIFFTSILLGVLLSCQPAPDTQQIISLDLNTVPESVALFGENFVSTALYERDIAIAPSGDEIIYTLGDYKQSKRGLVAVTREMGLWSSPQLLSFSGRYQDIEPFLSPDGNRLYFASDRPIFGDTTRSDYNIWYSDRTNGEWVTPVALDSVINTRGHEFFPSVSLRGTLYFTATRQDGIGSEDIFKSVLLGGEFQTPTVLPAAINSKTYEFNAYISPEEDLIVFSSYGRADDLGGGDLYCSQKDSAGNWIIAKNLGPLINSDKLDYCPFIDWKSRNLYFTSERVPVEQKVFGSVEDLRRMANSAYNGHGNIFRISLDRAIPPQ